MLKLLKHTASQKDEPNKYLRVCNCGFFITNNYFNECIQINNNNENNIVKLDESTVYVHFYYICIPLYIIFKILLSLYVVLI